MRISKASDKIRDNETADSNGDYNLGSQNRRRMSTIAHLCILLAATLFVKQRSSMHFFARPANVKLSTAYDQVAA